MGGDIMYLRKCPNKKTGRTQLDIVRAYRDKDGKSKHKTVMHIGYLDVVEKEYPDPIAHFTEVARKMTVEYKEDNKPLSLDISTHEAMDVTYNEKKNFGYAAFAKIYHTLDIKRFLSNKQRSTKSLFNHNSIFRLLVFSRLMCPSSKKATFENRNMFFEKADFTLDDVYRSLSFFAKIKDAFLLHLHKRLKQAYGRDTSMVYYDVTNYYFEIDEQDELRRKGVSKEHRPDPIVQMGLFMDTNGIPITYGLYPGNTLDKQTFIPMMDKVQDDFDLKRIVYVADKGMTSGDNIHQILTDQNGYVLSYSIRGADSQFKDYVLNSEGYVWNQDKNYKIKSRLYPREITVTTISGRKKKISVDEKQVVFYSQKYADKAKHDREPALKKAMELIKSPARYNRATSVGAAKYVKNLAFNPDTGEILPTAKNSLSLNLDLLKEEEKYDGYYAIVTSELKAKPTDIVDIYRGLWRIEESFKITKTEFATRPVYLSRFDHIESHFLICFTALTLARVLEHVMEQKYCVGKMLHSLRNVVGYRLEQNYFVFNYYDQILKDIGEKLSLDFNKKYMSLGEIKKFLGDTKK